MTAPVLAAAYALHMAATATWIGGLVFLVFFQPAAIRRLPEPERRSVQRESARRFRPIAWICLAVFAATGLAQMSASPSYVGVLEVGNPWSVAILLKHLGVLGMAVLLGVQTWILQPAQERARFLAAAGESHDDSRERRWDARLNAWSLALAAVVLILTAAARVSG